MIVNLRTIENKKSSVLKYLSILDRYKKYSLQEIETDIDIRGALERYLYLAIQTTIDLAEAIVAYKNLRKPTTMSENFYILQEASIIEPNLAKTLAKMVGFRNIIAHDYEVIDYSIVFDVLHNRLKDIELFLTAISSNLGIR